MKSICANCRNVRKRYRGVKMDSQLWMCVGSDSIDPVSGGPEEEYCEDKNADGRCKEFSTVKVRKPDPKPDPIDDLLEELADPPATRRQPWWLPILKWVMG